MACPLLKRLNFRQDHNQASPERTFHEDAFDGSFLQRGKTILREERSL